MATSHAAGLGIAVGYAAPEAPAEADLVTDAEGVATAAEAHILTAGAPAPGTRILREDGMSKSIAADRIRLKRIYEAPAAVDGARMLIDRLWPRGVKKADAAINLWMKDIAPSNELRQWFGHDPARWREFRRRYEAELRERVDRLEESRDMARHGPITLLFAARDEAHNDAVALRELILGKARE